MEENVIAIVSKEMQEFIVSSEFIESASSLHGGVQVVFRFSNGFGASVVNHSGSYGVELAVIKFNSEDNDDWELTYSTPITNDVIGYIQDEDELKELLLSIKNL